MMDGMFLQWARYIASALDGVPDTKEDYLEVPHLGKKLVFQVTGVQSGRS